MELSHVRKNPTILFVYIGKNPFPKEPNTVGTEEGTSHIRGKAYEFVAIWAPKFDEEILDQMKELRNVYKKRRATQ